MADLADPEDEQVNATIEVIAAAQADILALQDVDYDAQGLALAVLKDRLAEAGLSYPYSLSLRPNTGWLTGFDLNGDGHRNGARDAHGFGRFNGEGGMALLSRYPITGVTDLSHVIWANLPDGSAARFTPESAVPHLRLQAVGLWAVELAIPSGPLVVLVTHASAPVFDGPEDRNGWRNADQLRFLSLLLGGWRPEGLTLPLSDDRFAILGTLNVDPERGEGHRATLSALLHHPAIQDVSPRGGGGMATADWAEPDPGNLRVDYVLPAHGAIVTGHGVMWGADDGPEARASDHRLVWVDLRF